MSLAEEQDTALTMRDLVMTSSHSMAEPAPRRSVDVHIHAIVTPGSVSSLASLARLGTAIAGALRTRNQPSLPSTRESGTTDAATTENTEPEAEHDGPFQDLGHNSLLHAFNRGNESVSTSTPRGFEDDTDRSFSSEDLFRPSSSSQQDSLSDDPMLSPPRGGGRLLGDTNSGDEDDDDDVPSPVDEIGFFPEIDEADARERERQERTETQPEQNTGRPPTFLEVMRRTLRSFGLRSEETPVATVSTMPSSSSVHSSGSSTSSSPMRSDSRGSLGSIEEELELDEID